MMQIAEPGFSADDLQSPPAVIARPCTRLIIKSDPAYPKNHEELRQWATLETHTAPS